MIITRRDPKPIPNSVYDPCPAGCDLAGTILCWLRHEREFRADLAAAGATGSPDEEVLRADLRVAELRIDALIASVRNAAAPSTTTATTDSTTGVQRMTHPSCLPDRWLLRPVVDLLMQP